MTESGESSQPCTERYVHAVLRHSGPYAPRVCTKKLGARLGLKSPLHDSKFSRRRSKPPWGMRIKTIAIRPSSVANAFFASPVAAQHRVWAANGTLHAASPLRLVEVGFVGSRSRKPTFFFVSVVAAERPSCIYTLLLLRRRPWLPFTDLFFAEPCC